MGGVGKSWVVLFWLAFVILIFGLFLFNRQTISNSIQAIQNEITAHKGPPEGPVSPPAAGLTERSPQPVSPPSPQAPASQPASQAAPQTPEAAPPAQPAPSPPRQAPASTPAAQAAPQTAQPQTGQNRQAAQDTPAGQSPQAERSSQAGQGPAELRDRALYFTQVDRGGSILRVKVNRKLPVSDSPMTDAIQALIAGPSGEEKLKGLISLIPPGTRILSATVRGETAYISFSEDFQYNTYGVEGYAGQLKEIVFTATEFPNVRNVQILIEGRQVHYLGEGIWIGSPLNREML